jgi:hypothetical protein
MTIMAENDAGKSTAMVQDNQPQPDPPTTDRDSPSSNHNSTDDEFTDAGSSNDLNLDVDSERGWHALARAQSRALDQWSGVFDAENLEYKGPDIAYQIDQKLYTKAAMQNVDLTDDERALLLSRGDVFGKALAYPESLTTEEMHQVMYWPPPDILRATIQKVSGGTLNRPYELIAKAKEATERGRLQEDLNDDEVRLITQTLRDKPPRWIWWGNDGCPGHIEAESLVRTRLGVDVSVIRAVRIHQARERKGGDAQAGPASTRSDIEEVPIVDDDEEDCVDAIAKSMIRLQEKLGRGEVEKDAFIRVNRDHITSLKTLRERSGGDLYLDAIVTSMTRLQERFDRDEADADGYIRLNWGYVIPLSTFRENRRYSRKATLGRWTGNQPNFSYREWFVRLFWCDHYAEFDALDLPAKDLKTEVYKQWDALSKDQQEAYRARARSISLGQTLYANQFYPWAKLE